MAVRPTVRGVALALIGLVLVLSAYWTLQAALLVPAVLCIGVVVAGLVAILVTRSGTDAAIAVPPVAVEGADVELPVRLPAAFVGGWWRPETSLDLVREPFRSIAAEVEAIRVTMPFRGVHRIGPVRVRRLDPFGAWAEARTLGATAELVVGPRITPLSASSVSGHGLEQAARSLGRGDLIDQTVRDYRPGDPVRRIHWRQSARHGELRVRQEQPPATPRAIVVFDTVRAAWRDDDEFDEGVRAFASVCASIAAQGLEVEVRETGRAQLDGRRLASRTGLLDACARLEPVDEAPPMQPPGQAIVVVGAGSRAARRVIAELGAASSVWCVGDDPVQVPRRVRLLRWRSGDPLEQFFAAAMQSASRS